MFLYAVIDKDDQKLVFITDSKREADHVASDTRAEPGSRVVMSTEDFHFNTSALAVFSAGYEAECVRESVNTMLWGKGIDDDVDPDAFEKLAASIAADAYRSMTHYDTSEDYSIEEAMKEHEAEIAALLEKSQKV